MIIIDNKSGNWYIETSENTTIKTDNEIKEMFDSLSKLKISKAYYVNNMNDLVMVFNNQKIVLKNYPKIKNNLIMFDLNKQIKKGLINTAVSKISKKKTKLIKNGLIVAGSIAIFATAASLIKNSGKEENSSSSVSSISDNTNVVSQEKEEKHIITDEDLIQMYFKKYGSIFGVNDTTNLYNQNKNYLLASSNKEKEVIIILRDYFFENLYLKQPITLNTYTDYEQQKIILKYANIFGVNDVDTLCTMLAVHRLESGNGEEYICVNQNNLGGIFFNNPDTGEFETKAYPNIDVGAIDFVVEFLNIKQACQELPEYDSNRPLELNMNLKYCTLENDPYTPDWRWSERVAPIKEEVLDSGILDNYLTKKY